MKSKDIMIRSILLFFLTMLCSLSTAQVVDSGYINVGPDKIFYEAEGSGKVIIFIHDGMIPLETWDYQFPFFSKNYRVIRYDRRGYGKSSPSTSKYSNVEDLNTLFTFLHVDSACLVGASSGGMLAINFTLKYPQKVTALVLVGAVVGGFPYSQHFLTRGGHLPPNLKDFHESDLYYVNDDPYEIYFENKTAKEKALKLIQKYEITDRAPQSMPAKPYLRLNEIKVPALILAGEFDIPDVHAHAGVINAGIVNSRREIISKSGHLIQMEQPEAFNQAVEKFLKDIAY
jgi:pimeloyl-ACP methyl ester carboxylesterase